MESATKEQVEELCKKVHDLTELASKKSAEHEGEVKRLVEDVLKNHPGFTPSRKIEFANNQPTQVEEIIDSMPVELQKEADDLFIISAITRKKPNQLKRWNGYTRKLGDFKKALDTATAGGVLEWIPTGFSNQLFELVRLETKVMALFPQINMPTNPYVLPIQVGRLKSFKQPEQTADTSQTTIPVGDVNSISGKVTLTAVGHAVQVLCSKDAEEDSIVPMLPFLRSQIVSTLAEGREDCTLNGDIVSGTHEDTDVSDANDRRKMWTGLRALAIDNSYTADLSEFTLSNLRLLLRAKMGKYGVNPARLAYITGVQGYINLLNQKEVTTVDKYGAGATVLAGELAKIDGIPVIVSEWMREDLTASGIYGSGSTKSAIILVYRDAFATGVRRESSVQLLVELYAASDQDALITRERVCWSPIYPLATNATEYMGMNIG